MRRSTTGRANEGDRNPHHDVAGAVLESQTWRRLDAGLVRELWFRPASHGQSRDREAGGPATTVVIFPGLGLPRYVLPLAAALAAGGTPCVVVDALAFRRHGRRVPPTIHGLATAGAQCLRGLDLPGPVTVLGHSTGAQVALEVVVALQRERPDLRLVMGGPTFTPGQRRWRGLVPAALTAWRKDPPTELVVLLDLLRVRSDVARIVLSGRRHPTEKRVSLLRVPVRLTAGEADSFAPRPWLEDLAARSGAPSDVVVLPGSHNNVFTHVDELAALVVSVHE